MMLLIDAGNTRIKLARVSGDVWPAVDELPSRQADELPQYFAGLPEIQEVWVCNVAGEAVAQHIRAGCEARCWKPRFITARSVQCGVSNGYTQPEQLGCDRWAALLAAWHLVRGACLVVNCGTATTVDALSGQGEFIGGLILPGVELMQRSLSEAAAQLSMAQGGYQPFPQDTAAAIFSGSIQASCGAIERQYALLGDDAAPVLLSGGAAGLLRPHLKLPLRVTDNLVLQGVWLIAQETKT
ncbi:MAG: type III pantothenate kinase [Nitrosomonadales bacterium]|nr:type III pantothenate kinase [Nitrosomonadales bacterium]